MMIKGYYEIIVHCDKGCGEVIHFKHTGIINDSNDIITVAISKGFIGEENRKEVDRAVSVSKKEYKDNKTAERL